MGNLKEKLSIEKCKVYLGFVVMVAAIFGWLIKTVYSATLIEQRMFDSAEQKTQVIQDVSRNAEHRDDLNVHMPYQEKVKRFVTREEYTDLKELLKEMRDDIKYIKRRN